MALYKQWEELQKCVAASEGQSSPKIVPVPYTQSNSSAKKQAIDSAIKEKKAASARRHEASTPPKVLGDCSNTTKK